MSEDSYKVATALAAKDAVAREREALAKGRMAKWLGYPYGSTWESIAPEERAHWLESVSDVDAQSTASIREAERAACEAIVDEFKVDECGPDWGLSNDEQRRRIIARNRMVRGISAAIAARKGKS